MGLGNCDAGKCEQVGPTAILAYRTGNAVIRYLPTSLLSWQQIL